MQLTTSLAAAILATAALAAPTYPRSTNATGPAAPSTTALSLTAQLFLADTAVDRFTLLKDDTDFVFDFNSPALKGQGGKDGDVIAANRKTFPALVGTGAGMAVGFMDGCSFNTPHVHPRSVELQIVTQGRLMTEMVPENGVFNTPGLASSGRRVIKNEVAVNQVQPFYQGSIHTQFNPDCTPVRMPRPQLERRGLESTADHSTQATFVAAFTSEDFGTGQVADEFASFSSAVVSDSLGNFISGADVDKFKGAIPVSVAAGVEQCMQKCGMAKR